MPARWRQWIVDRFGLDLIKENFLFRRVPETPWYQGDGSTLMLLLGVLIITGMFMTPTYSPHPDTAYDSVQYITHQQLLGWFIRGLHYWSAGLMVVMLFFHLFRLILVGGYKFPREGTWLIGVAMFFLVIIMAYIGYVLRWDERAIYALHVSLNMFWNVPWIGEELVVFIQGGEKIGSQTLTRLYAVHVVFVPMLLVGLSLYHVYLVVVRGVTSKVERHQPVESAEEQKQLYHRAEQTESQSEQFYPQTTAKSGGMAFVVFLIALGLTLALGPRQLMPEANLVEPTMPMSEWYLWWYSALIALMPPWLAPLFVVAFPLLVFAALVLLPFIDRGPYRGIRKRPIAVAAVVLMVLGMLYLTDLRRRSPWTGWPEATPPPVPQNVELASGASQGRLLFATYGCTSCHAVGGQGRAVGPDLARLEHRISAQELQEYILQPPEGVPMPSYRGHIPPEDLHRIVEFVLAAQTFPYEQNTE